MNTDLTPFIEAERLLRNYNCTWHANYVARCREMIEAEGASAYGCVATGEWWGGSGSVADIFLHGPGGTPSAQEADNRKLRSALIKVHDLMIANGVRMDAATSWAEIFRKWQQMGI